MVSKIIRTSNFDSLGVRHEDASALNALDPAELKIYATRVAKACGTNLGQVWSGLFEPMLDSLSPAAVGQLVSDHLPNYLATRSRSRDNEPVHENVLGHAKPHHSNDAGSRQLRAWRDETTDEINSINATNRRLGPERGRLMEKRIGAGRKPARSTTQSAQRLVCFWADHPTHPNSFWLLIGFH